MKLSVNWLRYYETNATSSRSNVFIRWQHTHTQVWRSGNPHTTVRGTILLTTVATIVTTDFEVLYAYKRGDYQQCLQLSTQHVGTLLYAAHIPNVPTFLEFIHFMDVDIVSLTTLTLIVRRIKFRDYRRYCTISQLTLSLYLRTQC